MPDYGQKATDAEFRRLRAKINDVYKQAYKEIEQKGREFAQAHARREAQLRQMVADGKMTQADFDAWMRGQVFQGEQWQKKKQQMADTLYHADQVAQQMVNDSRYNVFAANANYMGYSLEHDRGIKTNFGLYDADSVRRLVKKEPDLLPPKKMVGKDKSYQWYNRQVQTAITQGIIQGESLDKIAHRIGKQTGETSMTAMLRNARTMQTGAQNAGRIEGLHQAQELGIKVKKQWMATLDSHTRDAHADLDGQIADVDEPFDSELGPIMYPGDPDADPANVWNCRCTLVYVYPEYPDETMKRRDNETGEIVADMTYREWEQMKRGEAKEEKSTFEIVKEYDAKIEVLNQAIENSEAEYQDLLFRQMMAFGTPEGDELTKQVNSFGEISASRYNELEKIRDERRRFLMQRGEPEIRRTIGIINGNHSIDDDLWAVNRITADDPRSFNNCGYCSLAYDARRRGIDCKAPYIYGANDTSMSEWWDGFSFQTTGKYDPQEAANAIISAAEQWGPGARGIVAVDHDVGMGHYFQFEVDSDGKCNFVDAQTGIMDARTAFDTASYGSVRYGRTDDKELTKSALFYLEKGGWGRDKYS